MRSKNEGSKTGFGLTGLVTLPIAVAGGWLAYSPWPSSTAYRA